MRIFREMLLSIVAVSVMLIAVGCSNQAKQFDVIEDGEIVANTEPTEVIEEIIIEPEETIAISDAELIAQLQQTRADYKRILPLMHQWYLEHGLHDKATWAKRELSDLNKVKTYFYYGSKGSAKKLSQIDESENSSMQAINISQLSEPDMVEQLMQIRTSYQSILEELNRCYTAGGDMEKAKWTIKELAGLDYIRFYPYLVVVDIQESDLTPRDSIVEADRMFTRARKLHEGAKFLPFLNNKHKLKEALDLYLQLIKCYPTSDKIDDAAFWAGEISKEYFNDDVQAVKYYELAIKWNPKTPHPARFQAAVVYDYRMHNREKAMELYQGVLRFESEIDFTNTRFAATRLNELLKDNVICEETD